MDIAHRCNRPWWKPAAKSPNSTIRAGFTIKYTNPAVNSNREILIANQSETVVYWTWGYYLNDHGGAYVSARVD